MKIRHVLLLCLCVLVLTPILSYAQTGAIAGTVTDSAGAVIPNAKVTVKNTETGATRTALTSDTGAYSITPLAVGNYDLTAESKGFRVAKVSGIQVTVAQTVSMNIKLTIGSVTETVEVKGSEVAQVDTETAQVSKIVDNVALEGLPLITRDPYSLVLLAPGTTQSNTSLGGFSVNGARERNNNFMLDGTDNNDTDVPGIAGGLSSLSPEATQEFRIITNSFAPEFGRNTGAIIDIVAKSGTNQFHGEGHWFGRYNYFGARDWFNKVDQGKQDPYVRNVFGYSLGGPVFKNRTFFFVSNEFQRFRTTLTSNATVPTESLKNGIISWTNPDNGRTTTVDFNNPEDPNNMTGIVGVDPAMAQILALYPSPNAGGDANTGLYYFPSASKYNYYNLTSKLDHKINDKHSTSFRYVYNKSDDPNGSHDEFLPGYAATAYVAKSHSLNAGLTSTLSNTLVNDFKAGWNRADSGFYCSGLDKLNFLGVNSLGYGRDINLPGISGFGCLSLGDSDGQARRTGTYSFTDNLTWVKGSHSFKMGAEFRFVYSNSYTAFTSRETLGFGSYSNWGAPSFYDTSIDNEGDDTSFWNNVPAYVQNLGWALTGSVDTQNVSQYFNKAGNQTAIDARKFRQREYGFYFQDSFKLRPNFTLIYGARYEFNGVPYEANGNLSGLMAYPNGTAPFTFQLVGPGTGTLLYNNDFSMFEPRAGFAWDIFKNGKTSLRGGFGIYHDRLFGNLFGNARGNPPFQQDYADYPGYWYLSGEQGPTFLSEIPFAPVQTPSPTVEDGAGIYPVLIDRNIKMPRSIGWNFGIEQLLTPNTALKVFYVGRQDDRILRVVDGNAPDEAKIQEALALAPTDPAEAAAYYASMVGSAVWFNTFNGISLVNNSAFYQAAVSKSIAKSNYNSLQVTLDRKLSHGLSVNGSYTWAHSADNASDPLVAGAGNRSFPRNSHHLEREWGNSDFDVRHRIVFSYTYAFPFGKGRSYLSNGMVGRVLEGWSLSGVTSWQTGHPFEVFGSRDSQHQGVSDRAELIGDPNASVTVDPTLGHYFGPAPSAFGLAPWNSASNLGRNSFYGPHFTNWNARLSKLTKINERFSLDLHFEAYNVFNHPNFTQPSNAWGSQYFGYSTGTVGNPDGTTGARQMQFGAKVSF